MGFVSFTRTEKTGMLPPGETGMKPDLMPVTLDKMLWIGTQGLSNVDCVTVWFWTDLHVSGGKGVLEGEGVCVYLWLELELHPGTRRGHDLLRVVPKIGASRVGDLYDLNQDCAWACRRGPGGLCSGCGCVRCCAGWRHRHIRRRATVVLGH